MRAHKFNPQTLGLAETAPPERYEIRIRGRLSETLLAAFPTLHADTQGAVTVLTGALPDQAALHGALAQIEALGLELLEVRRPSTSPGATRSPRKGGPGISRSDLLIINKTDLAPMVDADLRVMARDAAAQRGERPTLFTSLVSEGGAATVAAFIEDNL